ncbi:MAG: hypothetical protein ACI9JL_004312 [Paracoccaceae bacterium]|jgi:hypothetical protein
MDRLTYMNRLKTCPIACRTESLPFYKQRVAEFAGRAADLNSLKKDGSKATAFSANHPRANILEQTLTLPFLAKLRPSSNRSLQCS